MLATGHLELRPNKPKGVSAFQIARTSVHAERQRAKLDMCDAICHSSRSLCKAEPMAEQVRPGMVLQTVSRL